RPRVSMYASGICPKMFLCANGGVQPTPDMITSGTRPPAIEVDSFSLSLSQSVWSTITSTPGFCSRKASIIASKSGRASPTKSGVSKRIEPASSVSVSKSMGPCAKESGSASHAAAPRPTAEAPDAASRERRDSMDAVLSVRGARSEEHTSELQSRFDLVCRLLLEKKKERKPDKHEHEQ